MTVDEMQAKLDEWAREAGEGVTWEDIRGVGIHSHVFWLIGP
jgi:hypothetical protein